MTKLACGLCGHDPACGYAEADGVRLCHADDHSCYHRWTVYGDRPRDECPICGEDEEMGGDARVLRLSYLYKLDEASTKLQFHEASFPSVAGPEPFYTIRTCKSCRADFIGLLRAWCAGQIAVGRHEYNDERNIPVRVDGATRWMTRAEWNAYAGKEPF